MRMPGNMSSRAVPIWGTFPIFSQRALMRATNRSAFKSLALFSAMKRHI
jgi:hypothetical protein